MMTDEYHAYLLRMWRTKDNGESWRALLEDVETGKRHGFGDLDKLIEFLQSLGDEEQSGKEAGEGE